MDMTLTGVAGSLAFYLGLLIVASLHTRRIDTPAERKTFLFLGVGAGLTAFSSNILFARFGLMAPMPIAANALHTGIWIGCGFTYLWFATRESAWWKQFLIFVFTSFVVKYAEYRLLGTWDGDGFLGLGKGMFLYVLGWSAVDGLMPFLMTLGIRLVGRVVGGLALN